MWKNAKRKKGKNVWRAKVRRGVVWNKRTNEEVKKNRSGSVIRCYIKSNLIYLEKYDSSSFTVTTSPFKLFPIFPVPTDLSCLKECAGELGDVAVSIESPLERTDFTLLASLVASDLHDSDGKIYQYTEFTKVLKLLIYLF